jgi:hypothetical protein
MRVRVPCLPEKSIEGDAENLPFFSRATFRGIQNAFFQHRQGLMSEVSWRDYDSIIRLNLQRSDAREWWPAERDGFDEEFATYVDKILAEEWPDS